ATKVTLHERDKFGLVWIVTVLRNIVGHDLTARGHGLGALDVDQAGLLPVPAPPRNAVHQVPVVARPSLADVCGELLEREDLLVHESVSDPEQPALADERRQKRQIAVVSAIVEV